jgi:hypothetical protein
MSRLTVFARAACAIGTMTLPLSEPSAQQSVTPNRGDAQVLPGGEWAIGRWEGKLLSVGTSAGALNLNKRPVLLRIDRESDGKVTCRLAFVPPPTPDAGLTRRCVIGPNGISLTAANTTEIELRRSGPNGLQGKGTPPFAVAQQAPGLSGGELHLNRVQ